MERLVELGVLIRTLVRYISCNDWGLLKLLSML
jgi:hypothetical protein